MWVPEGQSLAASIAAVQPAPTVTTSTRLCSIAIALLLSHVHVHVPRPCDRQDHVVLRHAGIHRGHVAQTLHALVLRAVCDLVGGVCALCAGVADELPAREPVIAAVDRVGEHPLV